MSQRPIQTLRDGNISASIWRNAGQNGDFFSVTFERVYTDENGKPRNSSSYSGTELLKLSNLAASVYDVARQIPRTEAPTD